MDVTERLGVIQPEQLVGVNDFRREEAKSWGLSAARGLAGATSFACGIEQEPSLS